MTLGCPKRQNQVRPVNPYVRKPSESNGVGQEALGFTVLSQSSVWFHLGRIGRGDLRIGHCGRPSAPTGFRLA